MPAANSFPGRSVWKNFFDLGIFQAAGMLLQLIIIPIISTKYTLDIFGQVALSTSLAVVFGNLVSYGTHQTAIKAVAVSGLDQRRLSVIFSEVIFLRMLVFFILISLITFSFFLLTFIQPDLKLFGFDFKTLLLLFLSILPFIFSEVINPLFLLNGIEKIHWLSWGGLIPRIISFLLIFSITLNFTVTAYLNLFLNLPLLFFYIILIVFLFRRFRLTIMAPSVSRIRTMLSENFYIFFNGSSVSLQQTIFMVTIAETTSPNALGAYGIIDKLLGATRQIVSAFSLSIYPSAAKLYKENVASWLSFRWVIQKGYFITFAVTGLVIYSFAPQFTLLFAGSGNDMTTLFFRIFSFAPLMLALNANNVLDRLLSDSYRELFQIAVLILIFTIFFSVILSIYFNESALGWYPIVIESFCLVLYTIYPHKKSDHAIK